jgi:virulence factor Mce-like protein
MRRLAALTALLALAGTIVVFVVGTSAQGSSNGTFAVIFDDAKGLISGQLVKVAGAQAGTIESVTVTKNFKARVVGSIDSKFLPFHKDATCTIRPEGLIAENYVECDPGSASSPILRGNPPTVPVENTTEPINLLDLFDIFNLPTRERFQVIIDELGVGTAGRGDDFNDILLRANPALKLADQAIGILARQKTQLAQIIDATNVIAAQGAGHTADLQNFLDKAAALSQTTANHSSQLEQTIERLPALLDATQPSLQQLDTVARQGTPLLTELRAATPSLNHVAIDLGPFVKAATPGLNKIGKAIKTAIPAVRAVTPLIKVLRTYLNASLPETQLFAKLAENLQQRGFLENFLSVAYYIAAATAREDNQSHLLSTLLIGPGNGACATYASKPVAACSAHFTAQTASGATAATTPHTTPAKTTTGTTPTSSTGTTTTTATTPAAGAANSSGGSTGGLLGALLGGLLGGSKSSGSTATSTTGGAVNQTGAALANLLGYLTK